MSPYSDMKEDADELIWRALADPVRRSILDELAKRELTTGELVTKFDWLCRTAVMKHLDVLAKADLVKIRREGKLRWNHLNPIPIERVLGRWVQQHLRHMSASLNRLKSVVESLPEKASEEQPTPLTQKSRPRSCRNSKL
jgi:DNA-binding transcriptional ArsR family regulator